MIFMTLFVSDKRSLTVKLYFILYFQFNSFWVSVSFLLVQYVSEIKIIGASKALKEKQFM